jgi:hypothetical protein
VPRPSIVAARVRLATKPRREPLPAGGHRGVIILVLAHC